MKKILQILAVGILIIANLSISYSLQIRGFDPSTRGCATYVQLETGETLVLREGEVVSIKEKISCVVYRRGEMGWLQFPVKPKRQVDVSKKNIPVMCLAAIQRLNQKKNSQSSLELLTKEIPAAFEGQFPKGYRNNVKYWGNIDKEELHSCLPNGSAKLLTMDVDIGNRCSLDCPHCFRRKGFDKLTNPLTHEQIVGYIREAQTLGLKEVKILGRGEPFENPRFLEFLREMTGLDIGVAIFSKGHVLGNDELAKRYNEHYGITTGWELIQAIKELKVSVLLGFNSFNRVMQENFVGVDKYPATSPLKNYVEFRDKALINLVKAGFNEHKENQATRLALICAPIKPENIDEVFDLYQWARVRNMYQLSCPTTISGKGKDEYEREKRDFVDFLPRLEELYTRIYKWNLQTGLMTLDQFEEEGVSLYPGCHPCNQVAAGFYLNLSGQINQCPGRCDEKTVFCKDIRQSTLKEVWLSSLNYRRAKFDKRFNFGCPARDRRSLPPDFYKAIETRVLVN